MKQLSSTQHPLVKHLYKLQRDKQYRQQMGAIVVEGSQLIEELSTTHTPRSLLTTRPGPPSIAAETAYQVTDTILSKISTSRSAQHTLAEFPLPKPQPLHNARYLVACDAIQDPGNLGTIIRSALALGWEGIFFLENCCDPFNDKAMRAAKGASFHLPFQKGSWKDLLSLIDQHKFTPLVADMEGTPLTNYLKPTKPLLLLSSETKGARQESKKLFSSIQIPMGTVSESLNVAAAAAILLYALNPRATT